MKLKPGTRLESTTCETQVVVVRAPEDDIDVRCGGQAMVPMGEAGERAAPSAEHADGTTLGKRYASDDSGIELLCTKGGTGSLSIGDVALPRKDAKPLPSSD
jgi:hypothetical protein